MQVELPPEYVPPTRPESPALRWAESGGRPDSHSILALPGYVYTFEAQDCEWQDAERLAIRQRSIDEAMAEALTPCERDRFTVHLRPPVDRGDGLFTVAVAYLWVLKS